MKKAFIEVGCLTFITIGMAHWLSLFSSPKALIASVIVGFAGIVIVNFHLPSMDIRHRAALSLILLSLFIWAAKGASFTWFL
jgi:hypothetical protein